MSSPFVGVFNKHGDGADLDGVRIVGRVLKQTVVRVEQFPWEQEEELTRRSTVVQTAQQQQHIGNN